MEGDIGQMSHKVISIQWSDCIIEEDTMNMGATGSHKWTDSTCLQSSSEAC